MATVHRLTPAPTRCPTSHTEVEAAMLARAVHAGCRALEVGCGRTTRLGGLRDRIVELVGIDMDTDAGWENQYLDRFVEADTCAGLPFPDGRFDLVYANFVVEHLADPAAAFREWRRVLRPGGGLVLLTSNVANPLLKAARLLPQHARVAAKRRGAGAADRDVFPAVYRANTPRLLAAALAEAGFAEAETETVATLHRYAGGHRRAAGALVAAERALPAARRSTIVARFTAV